MLDIAAFKTNPCMNPFRLVELADAQCLFEWRNRDAVRHMMRHPELISWEQHHVWLHHMQTSLTDLYLVYKPADVSLGLLYFNHIDTKTCTAEWGFYLGERNLPAGTGTQMMRDGLYFAFTQLRLAKLRATVMGHNPVSSHLHRKLGFIEQDGIYELSAEIYSRH